MLAKILQKFRENRHAKFCYCKHCYTQNRIAYEQCVKCGARLIDAMSFHSPDAPTKQWRISDVIIILFVAIVTPILIILPIGVILKFAGLDIPGENAIAGNLFGLISGLSLGIVSLLWVRFLYRLPFSALGLTTRSWLKYAALGLLMLIPVLVIELGVETSVMYVAQLFGVKDVHKIALYESQRISGAMPFDVSPIQRLLSFIFIAMAIPLAEEIFFRGIAYTAFKHVWGKHWAYLVSAALFAGMHFTIIYFLPLFILGILLAYLYERTNSLVAPITLHMASNATVCFLWLI